MWPQVLSLSGYPSFSLFILLVLFLSTRLRSRGYVGISEFGSLGVSMPHLVMVLFWYIVAIFVVIPHSFVTLHHHELVCPRLGHDFPHPLNRTI